MENIRLGSVIKWILMGGAFLLLAGILLNVFGVIGSVATAPGRVINKTLETNNIIQSYEWFYDVNAAYAARLSQIDQFQGFYADEAGPKERSRLRMEMAAIQQTCRDLAEKYNANSMKMNKSIFKGWQLPETLQLTNCE